MLIYITRAMKSVDGLPRVFFCCHPDDYSKCLRRLSNEILELADCVIFHKSDPSEEIDEDILQQMQMFVVPVTSVFLNTENAARNKEYAFALENHIPIMPIIADENVTPELFNKICGDIQYIDPYSTSTASISCKEKMKAFLKNTLTDSETIARIKNEFQAYIFLSYRKKDRGYVNEVVKAVHSDERCDDVAVWYDEYLTPGEDFNENISKNIDKSQAVILLVTPNINESGNFVMTIEYPAALKQKKIIIPVEAVNTDRSLLEMNFENIPAAVVLNNTIAVSKMITDNLKLSDTEFSAEKNYLLGLAYMSMIDVEKNPEKGIYLLNKAADEKHIGALEKLVSIYENGDGTAVDLSKAAYYQKKICYIYALLPGYENRCRYMENCFRLGEIYLNDVHSSNSENTRLFTDLISESEKMLSDGDHPEAVMYYFTAMARMCEVYHQRERFDSLPQAADKIIEMYDKYKDSIQTEKFKSCMLNVCITCADAVLIYIYSFEKYRNAHGTVTEWIVIQGKRQEEKEKAILMYENALKLAFDLFLEDPRSIERRCSFVRAIIGTAASYERSCEPETGYYILKMAENIKLPSSSELTGMLEKSMGINRFFSCEFESSIVFFKKASEFFYRLENRKGGNAKLLIEGLVCNYIAVISQILLGNMAEASQMLERALSVIDSDKSRNIGDVYRLKEDLEKISEIIGNAMCEDNMQQFWLELYEVLCESSEFLLGSAKHGLVFFVSDRILGLYGEESCGDKMKSSRERSFVKLLDHDSVSVGICSIFTGRSEKSVRSALLYLAMEEYSKNKKIVTDHLDDSQARDEKFMKMGDELYRSFLPIEIKAHSACCDYVKEMVSIICFAIDNPKIIHNTCKRLAGLMMKIDFKKWENCNDNVVMQMLYGIFSSVDPIINELSKQDECFDEYNAFLKGIDEMNNEVDELSDRLNKRLNEINDHHNFE